MKLDAAPAHRDRPLQAIEEAHDHALAALADHDAAPLGAVVWLSAHLAALQHVIHPVLRGLDSTSVDALRAGAVRIELTLRTLERVLSGDALVAGIDRALLVRALAEQVSAQARNEHRLLNRLADRMSAEDQRRLVAAYDRALETGPTRPHPHAPHRRAAEGLAFRVNGLRDRFMDTVDSRPVPTPRPPRKLVRSTLWGHYLLGTSISDHDIDHDIDSDGNRGND